MTIDKGLLYIVATPIGNLSDISKRAIEVLSKVDLIACEDTRHSKPLLDHLGIDTPLMAVHEHNEQKRTEQLLKKLKQGQSIALISDAGTPLISDPGFYLVRELKAAGIEVSPIPGASALISALSASGLATDRFSFEGFLPAKSAARQKRLQAVQHESRTMVFYETPHRISDCINDCIAVFGEQRMACIAREITKKFETIISASLNDLKDYLAQDANHTRGEFVLIIEGQPAKISYEQQQADALLDTLEKYLPLSKAAAAVAEITGEKKKTIYQRALERRASAS
jgi:16S rRNA (cytidine1402-2'-O)-methyltransferase